MVAMRVRDEDMGNAGIADRADERVDVTRIVRPRVEHGNVVIADQKGVRPLEGERPGISRRHPPHAGGDRHRFAVHGRNRG